MPCILIRDSVGFEGPTQMLQAHGPGESMGPQLISVGLGLGFLAGLWALYCTFFFVSARQPMCATYLCLSPVRDA